METRIRNLEDGVVDLKSELKLMRQTLSSIDKTLTEFKSISEKLIDIKLTQTTQGKDIEGLLSRTNSLFKKTDSHDLKLETLEKSDAEQGIKLGGAEKFVWAIITAFIGVAIGVWQGSK